jgi:hypothetical protein
MALSKEEREQFLAEPHIAALSVSAGEKARTADGPDLVPVQPGRRAVGADRSGSRKHRLIETQGNSR